MRQAIEGKILARIECIEIFIGVGVKFYPNVLESLADLLVVELWNSPSQLDPVISNGLSY